MKRVIDSPGMPGEPTVEEVGSDFVSLTWDKPSSDGGGKIQGYFVEKKDAGSDNWSRINQVPCPTNIFNIPHLIEDREYEFRVFAVNEAGESKPSSATRKIKIKDPKGLNF
jgi:hypothetical protein